MRNFQSRSLVLLIPRVTASKANKVIYLIHWFIQRMSQYKNFNHVLLLWCILYEVKSFILSFFHPLASFEMFHTSSIWITYRNGSFFNLKFSQCLSLYSPKWFSRCFCTIILMCSPLHILKLYQYLNNGTMQNKTRNMYYYYYVLSIL